MIFGTCIVQNGKIKTLRKVFVITEETHPEVNLIFRTPSIIGASGLCLFGVGFSDLLTLFELFIILAAILFLLLLGFQLGSLQIHDRVTRGTQDATAVYGLDYKLRAKLKEINKVIPDRKGEAS